MTTKHDLTDLSNKAAEKKRLEEEAAAEKKAAEYEAHAGKAALALDELINSDSPLIPELAEQLSRIAENNGTIEELRSLSTATPQTPVVPATAPQPGPDDTTASERERLVKLEELLAELGTLAGFNLIDGTTGKIDPDTAKTVLTDMIEAGAEAEAKIAETKAKLSESETKLRNAETANAATNGSSVTGREAEFERELIRIAQNHEARVVMTGAHVLDIVKTGKNITDKHDLDVANAQASPASINSIKSAAEDATNHLEKARIVGLRERVTLPKNAVVLEKDDFDGLKTHLSRIADGVGA